MGDRIVLEAAGLLLGGFRDWRDRGLGLREECWWRWLPPAGRVVIGCYCCYCGRLWTAVILPECRRVACGELASKGSRCHALCAVDGQLSLKSNFVSAQRLGC